MRRFFCYTATPLVLLAVCYGQNSDGVRTTFHIRYVAGTNVYIDGGRNSGLTEGMKLKIAPPPSSTSEAAQAQTAGPVTAQIDVVSVADNSAMCDVVSSTRDLVVGDTFTLAQDDAAAIVTKRTLSNSRAYPAVVSFTEGDPMDEDVREQTPRPPLPEVNRAHGRLGVEYSGVFNGGQYGSSSSEVGLVFRGDVNRIGGTYWNLSGYWRGRLNMQSSSSPTTLQDLMNRTYHLSLTYDNPNSRYVMGLGRMYLPWASSLETIDGAYAGRKLGDHTVAGLFAGSTPDPTSWSYDPNRRLGGGFVSFTEGDYDSLRMMTTVGMGIEMERWTIDRPFVFAENTISYKQIFSVFDAVQVDRPAQQLNMPAVGAGLKQAFTSMRLQPANRVTFSLNYNYFRDVPTYDPQLVGTGLLDKFLFQGLSGGVRVEGPKHLTFYTDIGRSSSSRDNSNSWNTMYGVTVNQLWRTGLRIDARYSRFNSDFAQGNYRSISVSRNIADLLRLDMQFGTQSFNSPFTSDNGSHFLNSMLEWNLGSSLFLDNGFTVQHGGSQNYRQVYLTIGYRFDNRPHRRMEVGP